MSCDFLTWNGLGTDATIAQHIQTILDRGYVFSRVDGTTKYLVPSALGIGLVEGYNAIEFDKSLSKPQLRREVRAKHCMFILYYYTQLNRWNIV